MIEHMTLQKRHILAAFACLLSVGFAVWSCSTALWPEKAHTDAAVADMEGTQSKTEAAGKAGTKKGKKKAQAHHQAVRGAGQAEQLQALCDPFTPQHETAAEVKEVLAAAQAAAPETAAQPSQATLPQMTPPTATAAEAAGTSVPATSPTTEPSSQPVITLQGMVTGTEGGIALLSDGRQVAAVAPGEWFDGWCLIAVGSEGAELANDSGALHLDMQHF